jgi:hypothetical protein
MAGHTSHNEGMRVLKGFVCQAIPDSAAPPRASLQLEIEWPGVNLANVAVELIAALPQQQRSQVALSVTPLHDKSARGAKAPAVLSATISENGASLRPLLAALLKQVKRRKGESLVAILPDHTKHELHANASPRQISQFVSTVTGAGSARIAIA